MKMTIEKQKDQDKIEETLIKQIEELQEENRELRKFVEYVRSLKTKEDFLRLRNVILDTNKKFKWKN